MLSANDWIDQGLEFHQAGDVSAAAIAYRHALEQDPAHPDALNLLGVLAHQAGDFTEAIRLIGLAIRADPTAADFYANLAEAHRAVGAIAPAIDAYVKSTSLDGSNAAVWANLATLLQKTRRFAEAVETWERAVTVNPSLAEYQNNYGLALAQAGRASEAIAPLRRALELRPDFPVAIENLAECYLKANRLDEAANAARLLVDLKPKEAASWVFYAAACNDAGHLHEAIDACREAIKLEPDRVQAHFVMGQTLNKMGESAGAALAYAKVTELRPDVAAGHASLGLAALAVGQLDEAAAALTEATDVNPQYAEAWFNLAVVHERMAQYDRAIEFSEKARALRPGWAAVSSMIGNLHLHQGRHAEAEAEFCRALQENPEYIPALAGMGNVQGERGDHQSAIVYIKRALEINPTDAVAHSVLLMSMVAGNFSREEVFDCHVAFGCAFDRPANHAATTFANVRDPGRRLRIGYLSPDLRAHSVAFFLTGLLKHHDHARFEIIAYDDTSKPDSVSHYLRSLCNRWHRIVGMNHDRLAELIREHEIDILIDLAGHTSNNRMPLFAIKPAPLQFSYLGYPATSGLKAIDYRFTDALADPLDLTDIYHSEKLIRLPRSFLAYSPPVNAPPVEPLPALTNGYVTFASFNNTTKLHPGVYTLWARVLHAIPGARLILKANGFVDSVLRDRVHRQFAESGIDASRLTLLAKTPTTAEHLAVYGRCDMALDSFPYNGTTTTCEAMWMGVPVITLAGRAHAGRVGVSLLTNVGFSDWIAETTEEYVAIAVKMAADLPTLAGLRAGMRQQMAASPVMDSASLTKNIEAAYRSAWQTWCKQAITHNDDKV